MLKYVIIPITTLLSLKATCRVRRMLSRTTEKNSTNAPTSWKYKSERRVGLNVRPVEISVRSFGSYVA